MVSAKELRGLRDTIMVAHQIISNQLEDLICEDEGVETAIKMARCIDRLVSAMETVDGLIGYKEALLQPQKDGY